MIKCLEHIKWVAGIPKKREICVWHQLHHKGILWTAYRLKLDEVQFSITWAQLPLLSTAVSSTLHHWVILNMLRGAESWLQHHCEMGEWLCLYTFSHWVWSAVKQRHRIITQCSAPGRCGLLLLLWALKCGLCDSDPKDCFNLYSRSLYEIFIYKVSLNT